MSSTKKILQALIDKYPELKVCSEQIWNVYQLIHTTYEQKGKLLLCGNGGSAADADHIAGELMKGFMKKRPLEQPLMNELKNIDLLRGQLLCDKLQLGLPAIALTTHSSLISAVINDTDAKLIYAQQVIALGKKEDVVWGISTSGNAENVIHAFITAKAMGLKTIGLSGVTGGAMKPYCDCMITVPSDITPAIQELHLPIYHAICKMIEESFFVQ